jgi:hypothetical protein
MKRGKSMFSLVRRLEKEKKQVHKIDTSEDDSASPLQMYETAA